MAWEIVGVVMSEKYEFEMRFSLGYELLICLDIEDWINQDTFILWLDVVREDGQLWSLPLSYVESLPTEFTDKS